VEVTPPIPFEPRNALERSICDALESFAEGEVFSLQTREEYLASEDDDVWLGDDFAYFAVTGIRWQFDGNLRAGENVGVKLVEQQVVLEILARWFT
jgi:hypothetical protein